MGFQEAVGRGGAPGANFRWPGWGLSGEVRSFGGGVCGGLLSLSLLRLRLVIIVPPYLRFSPFATQPPPSVSAPVSVLPGEGRSGKSRVGVRGQCQMGSLTGAVHPSNDNAGVPRPAQRGQKPRVEQKGKCWLDPDFQYEYGP